jgi:uncharacterized protein RhaS with RHS repeats
MGCRYYNPASGRFLTKDPVGFAGGINAYAYAGNDPVNLMDPGASCGSARWIFPTASSLVELSRVAYCLPALQ